VAGGFQANGDFIAQKFQLTEQGFHPGLGVFGDKDGFFRLAVVIHESHGVFMLGNIDPTIEHRSTSLFHLGSEAPSDSHETLSLVCFAPPLVVE
jgi:hypothetical protein